MRANHFGQMLIILGIFFALVFLLIADWYPKLSVMQNIRYADLFCSEPAANQFGEVYCAGISIKLRQGLIFPLVLIAFGALIVREIISEKLLCKILPFMIKSANKKVLE